MGIKAGSGFRLNYPDHIFESLETTFWVKIHKFFDVDPGSKYGSGIRDERPASATLADTEIYSSFLQVLIK
jgi:hypothetical protein